MQQNWKIIDEVLEYSNSEKCTLDMGTPIQIPILIDTLRKTEIVIEMKRY